MTGFEGIGDFDSSDPYQRYIAHQAAKGNYQPSTAYSIQCACSKCTTMVKNDEYTFPYCVKCYINLDGKCD